MSATSLFVRMSNGQDDTKWKLNPLWSHSVKSSSITSISVMFMLHNWRGNLTLFSAHIICVDDMRIHPMSPTQKCRKKIIINSAIIIVQFLCTKWEWEIGSCFLRWVNRWEIYISQLVSFWVGKSPYMRNVKKEPFLDKKIYY